MHTPNTSAQADVLAIGKFGTIPERPIQSRPVRADLYDFQDIFELLKFHMVERSPSGLCISLVCLM